MSGSFAFHPVCCSSVICGSGLCTVGHYCPSGTSTPVACPLGTYGSTQGLSSAACTNLCAAGLFVCFAVCFIISASFFVAFTFADLMRLEQVIMAAPQGRQPAPAAVRFVYFRARSLLCCLVFAHVSNAGQCSAGYYCTAGSTTPTENPCPPLNYCPAGSSGPSPCQPGLLLCCCTLKVPYTGYYCAGSQGGPTPCPAGSYCPGGTLIVFLFFLLGCVPSVQSYNLFEQVRPPPFNARLVSMARQRCSQHRSVAETARLATTAPLAG